MVADLAYHGGQGENPHAHIMLTTQVHRPGWLRAEESGLEQESALGGLARGLGRAARTSALERHGYAERIDHRTLVAQRDEALAARRHRAGRNPRP